MSKYAVSNDGVAALRLMANSLDDVVEHMNRMNEVLTTIADEHTDALGPHRGSIDYVLSEVSHVAIESVGPISEISEQLNDIADAYQEIIDNDRMKARAVGRVNLPLNSSSQKDTSCHGQKTSSIVNKIFGGIIKDKSSKKFGQYEVDVHGFVKGINYESFIKVWEGYDPGQFETVIYEDKGFVEYISPEQIEGINLSENDIKDPSLFWQQHESGGTAETFKEIASHIPEVQSELMKGRRVSDLVTDPILGKCAAIYFEPSSMPQVILCEGYYEFQSNGRHRILAARELGYNIPVRIIGARTRIV